MVVDGLEVVAGGELVDERLQGINLARLMPRIELELFDPSGRHLGSSVRGQLGILRADSIEGQGSFLGSFPSLSVRQLPVDLVVSLQGFLRAELHGISADTKVHLEAAPQLHFRLPDGVVPPEGWTLLLAFEPLDDRPWQMGMFSSSGGFEIEADSDGRFGHDLSRLGSYAVSLGATKGHSSTLPDALIQLGVMDLSAAADGETRTLAVTRAQLDELCAGG